MLEVKSLRKKENLNSAKNAVKKRAFLEVFYLDAVILACVYRKNYVVFLFAYSLLLPC